MIVCKASALDRIMRCVGSHTLAEQAPKLAQMDDAKEGEAFHHFGALLLDGKGTSVKVGDVAPNGHVLDAEMLEHAKAYAETFAAPDLVKRVECDATWGIPDLFQVRGRADVTIWHAEQRTLAVTDAKYGFRWVEPDNWQNISYAIGTCFALGIRPDKIILAIYQPRVGRVPLRSVELSADDLLDDYTQVVEQMQAIAAGADLLETGPHCRYCPGAIGCAAVVRASYNAVDVALNDNAFGTTPETFRAELDVLDRAAEVIKQRIKLIEGAALADLGAGKRVPGLSTDKQLGNTAWLPNSEAELRKIQAGSNELRFFDEKPVTPAEAKRRGLTEEDYKRLTHRPTKGLHLVRQDASERAAAAFAEQETKPKRKRASRKKPAQ